MEHISILIIMVITGDGFKIEIMSHLLFLGL